MEKIKNREEYIKGLLDFLPSVELNDEFMNQLKAHQYFGEHIKNIEDLKTEESKKVYVFLELTKERKSCEAIIEMLIKSKQTEAAQKLKEYNTSPGLINILNASTNIDIPVLRAKIPKDGTNPYKMLRNPRGIFIIINNVPNELYRESLRFEHIFKELYFETDLWFKLTAEQIEQKLKYIANEERFRDDQAFGVMIITHGMNESVLGFNACEEFRKDEHLRNKEIIAKDQMKISDLVQIFSKEKCPKLAQKPKVFVFNCCREKYLKPSVDIISLRTKIEENIELNANNECVYKVKTDEEKREEIKELILKYKSADHKWVNENTHTFIINSCSEGYYSWFLGNISCFGQSFSHAIARYACEESLQTIMCRTCTLMEQFKNVIVNPLTGGTAFSAPELRKQCTGRELYFNAGVYEVDDRKRFTKNK